MVETRERDRVAEREVRRDPANRSDLAFDVVEPDVAFRRSIKFENADWSESVENGAPNLLRKPVADREPQPVSLLLRATWRGDKIAAEFADILKRRALPARDVVPEAARRKALGDSDRTAENQRGADRDDAAHAVMHRQAIVEAVGRSQARKAGKPMAPDDEPAVTDFGGLRQPCRSRGEDPQRAIGERDRSSLVLRERLAAPA